MDNICCEKPYLLHDVLSEHCHLLRAWYPGGLVRIKHITTFQGSICRNKKSLHDIHLRCRGNAEVARRRKHER